MKKAFLIISITLFFAASLFAQMSEPVVIDKLGYDCDRLYYVQTSLGPKIALDENNEVHVVYNKAWVAGVDTAFALLYKNITTGAQDTIRPQQPTEPIKPSRAFIGGGRGEAPLFIYYGVSTYDFQWGNMPLQAMAKVDENSKVVPLGTQSDKNYYADAWYALPINMEVNPISGLAHCILSNVGGDAIAYWNFDGTNFGEIYQMYFVDAGSDVPGKDVPGKYRRNATKGADLAVSKDGETVAVGGLHPWSNIDVTFGEFGGEIWPDDFTQAMDEGTFVTLFDTTGAATGDNIDHDKAMPATDLQLAFDDDDVLHIVYEAAWFSQYLDTLSDASFTARNSAGVDNWTAINGWNWTTTYFYLAGDENAVYYGSGKPKPQIRYWNSTMPLMAGSSDGHTKIAESVYPMPGEEYKWFRHANIDSGGGVWGNRTDCLIADVDLIINSDPQEGEPKAVVVWEEMMSDPTIIEDTDLRYVGFYKDISVSVSEDFTTWSAPANLTNTPEMDEGSVSVYGDVVDGMVHMVYNSDNMFMSDYFLSWTESYTDFFNPSGPSMRANADDYADFMYATIDVSGIVAGVEDRTSVPGEFKLAQNFPNPFNPTTLIEYTVPSGDVTLDIYNVLGQKVRTLVDEHIVAGTYAQKWDGTNELGAKVSNGVYIYQLKSAAGEKVRKMMLTK
jgi:hypothetical protein